ncbi:sulfite exporter TauE/SafE family protein [Priestia megaterium]|uniref:sulfite exporter TauE/SafE family protein n=1 Tax=Priestia megaterium TaxID=1404 RepID=UPI001BEBA8C2|nr:sulfite exporter TauE/SafE family protein [Priestia megaterium]MBT2259819.1 sulfite exporter TauE/SafE family protein [Priestia megaterium]MBT2281820.1 sulfite exporter TauE/SafE family protein [Priestia megaterium]
MEDLMVLIIIVFVASLLQTSTGYGFSIVGTPFLLLIYPAHMAIQINIILSICLSAFMIFKIRKEIDKSLLVRLIKGSVMGLIFGILIYIFLDIQLLKMTVGALILFLTILLILKLTINRTQNKDFITGGISGLLTTSIGVPGPPLLLYFSGAGIDKTTLRSTTLAYYLFVYFVSLVMQISFGGTSKETWIFSLIAIPPLFTGIILGQLFFKWISQKVFRIITYIILMFTGVYLLVTSF